MKYMLLVSGLLGLAIASSACGGGGSSNTAAPTAVSGGNALTNSTSAPPQAAPTEVQPTAVVPTEAAAAQSAAATQAPTLPVATAAQSGSGTGGGQGVPVGDIKTVLSKACDALKAQPNVSAHLVITGDSPADFLVEVEGKDHAHTKISSPKSSSEAILLPTGFYQNENGSWTKLPGMNAQLASTIITAARDGAGLFICFPKNPSPDSPLSGIIDGAAANLALPEIVDGVPNLVYDVNVTVNNKDGSHGTGEAKYWLGATDSVPHKMSLSYTGVDKSGKPVNGQIAGTYSYQGVDIQAPIQ